MTKNENHCMIFLAVIPERRSTDCCQWRQIVRAEISRNKQCPHEADLLRLGIATLPIITNALEEST